MPVGNLALSGLIYPKLGEGSPAELSFVVAVALYDTIISLAPTAPLQLKWPNDILLNGGKISGILLERDRDAMIVGVGVNIVAAPTVADKKTASLADIGLKIEAGKFAEIFVSCFETRRKEWRDAGFAATRSSWLKYAHPVGSRLQISNPNGGRTDGTFAGLNLDGAMLLDIAGGERLTIHAGDVWLATDSPVKTA